MVEAPLLAVGDGALGLWVALRDVYPSTRHQRCWNHRALNVLDKLARRLHGEARGRLHAIYEVSSRVECGRLRAAYAQELRARGHADAAARLERDAEDFLTFYDFSEEHWLHLRKPTRSSRRALRRRQTPTSTGHGGRSRIVHLFHLLEASSHKS